MVPAEVESHSPALCAHDSPGISNVGDIAHIVHKQSGKKAGSTFIWHALAGLVLESMLQELLLYCCYSFCQCLFGLGGEVIAGDKFLV